MKLVNFSARRTQFAPLCSYLKAVKQSVQPVNAHYTRYTYVTRNIIVYFRLVSFRTIKFQWSLYVPPVVTICTTSLTFNNSTFCPHSVFMCFVWIWEQTAIISLYSVNWLVCITETECVYCAVRTEYLYIIPAIFSLQGLCHDSGG
jgi:hypothetical protein